MCGTGGRFYWTGTALEGRRDWNVARAGRGVGGAQQSHHETVTAGS